MLKTYNLFPQMKTSRKVHIFLYYFLYPPDAVMYCYAKQCKFATNYL